MKLEVWDYKGFWFHVGERNSMISYSRLPIKGFGFINLEFIHQAKEGLKPIATHSLSDVVHLLLLISPALPGFDRSASRISPYINHFDCFVQNTILLPITFFMSLKKKWYHRTMQTFFQRKSSRHVYVRVEQDLKLAML